MTIKKRLHTSAKSISRTTLLVEVGWSETPGEPRAQRSEGDDSLVPFSPKDHPHISEYADPLADRHVHTATVHPMAAATLWPASVIVGPADPCSTSDWPFAALATSRKNHIRPKVARTSHLSCKGVR